MAETIRAFLAEEFPQVPYLEIREIVALSDAAAARQPITHHRARSTGADDYRTLAQLVATHLQAATLGTR